MIPTGSDVEYAVWTAPGTSFTVTYSLELFHEIDFVVNEGYRRIPHGGVEIGGLLFGHSDEHSARIEAFRTIECDHASGPSFVLSDQDLTNLGKQLAAVEVDPELRHLSAIGWFIAHTRRPLTLDDRESALFDQLFPGLGKITLLIKPERFQATRFGFLVRRAGGEMERDASRQAIILPLSKRAGHAAETPLPSTPAPSLMSAPQSAPEPVPRPEAHAQAPVSKPESKPIDTRLPKPEPLPATSLATVPRASAPAPLDESRTRQSELFQSTAALDALARRQHLSTGIEESRSHSNARLAIVLFLAAALGCVVGYWAYLQLPSPAIPLTVRSEPSRLLISWPPEQTRDAAFAAIRVDDGDPLPLSAADKAVGETEVMAVGGNVKIELIAQHWLRDSRGIVRYVRALKPPASTNANPPS